MEIDEAVIDRSAEEGARYVALALLAQADEAAERLAAGSDQETLHDFRVALRRTRSTLRAFRPWLEGSLKRKQERQLRKLARASNGARDAEVALAWLGKQRGALGHRQRAAVDFLSERLEARRTAWGREQADVLARYARVSRKLVGRLQTYRGRIDASARSSTYCGALAGGLAEHLVAMRQHVAGIRDSSDEANIHSARIEGKRLRYLLEPLRGNRHADTRQLVKSLRQLQDVLGELHDCHRLAADIAAALVDAAVARARELHEAAYDRGASGAQLRDELRGGPRAGLLALDRLLLARREALYVTLGREWREGGGLEALAGEIQALVATLEARAGGRIENERKFLLSGLPERAQEVAAVHVVQGWLPGERIQERIRRVSGVDGERYRRGIKQGAGPRRLETEEEITREVFEALWPLTEGRRISKRRRRIVEGRVSWDIDQFEGRDLVLAEAELPARDVAASIPEWLRPYVVREVTDDPAYLNYNFALAQAPAEAPTGEPDSEASPPPSAEAPPGGSEQEASPPPAPGEPDHEALPLPEAGAPGAEEGAAAPSSHP
jgi:CHAD domain-containing protein/CYTH domain-containing protein